MHNDVRGLRQNFFGVGGNFHSPGRVAGTNHFAEIPPDFCRVVVDGAANFNRGFFAQQSGDRGANRPNAVLNRAYLLFHRSLRLLNRKANFRGLMLNAKILAVAKPIR